MTPHARHLCERLAEAIEYPRHHFAATVQGCRSAARECPEAVSAPLERFGEAIQGLSSQSVQELYLNAFDLEPACALHIGSHLYGERGERADLLAQLRAEMRTMGIVESSELPDHLTNLLRLLSRLPADRGAELAALVAPPLDRLLAALRTRQTPYADLIQAIRALVTASAAQGVARR